MIEGRGQPQRARITQADIVNEELRAFLSLLTGTDRVSGYTGHHGANS
jgi:hypothetical protein